MTDGGFYSKLKTRIVRGSEFLVFIHSEPYFGPYPVKRVTPKEKNGNYFDKLMGLGGLPFRQKNLLGWDNRKRTLLSKRNLESTDCYYFSNPNGPEIVEVVIYNPLNWDRHRMLGYYFGYPSCCIKYNRNPTNPEFYKFKNREVGYTGTGFLACPECLKLPKDSLLENIARHRISPIPSLDDETTLAPIIEAHIAFINGRLNPWKWLRR